MNYYGTCWIRSSQLSDCEKFHLRGHRACISVKSGEIPEEHIASVEEMYLSETSADFQRGAWRYIPQDEPLC
jgi:hypothetical protein